MKNLVFEYLGIVFMLIPILVYSNYKFNKLKDKVERGGQYGGIT